MGKRKPRKKTRESGKIQQQKTEGSPDGHDPIRPPLPLPDPPQPEPEPEPEPVPVPEPEPQQDADLRKDLIDRLGNVMLPDTSTDTELPENAATAKATGSAGRLPPLGLSSPTLENIIYIKLQENEDSGDDKILGIPRIVFKKLLELKILVGGDSLELEGAVGGVKKLPKVKVRDGIYADYVFESKDKSPKSGRKRIPVKSSTSVASICFSEYEKAFKWDGSNGRPPTAIFALGCVIRLSSVAENIYQPDCVYGNFPWIMIYKMPDGVQPDSPPNVNWHLGNAMIVLKDNEPIYIMPLYSTAEAALKFNKQLAEIRVALKIPIPPGAQLPDPDMKPLRCDICPFFETNSGLSMHKHMRTFHPRLQRQKKTLAIILKKINDTQP